jgi:LysM repeat protein
MTHFQSAQIVNSGTLQVGNMNRPTLRQATAVAPNFARRRFVVVATAITVATITALSALTGQSATATSQSSKAEFTYVTVLAGQSLWQIAAKVAPDQDPRDFIASVVSLNGLTTADVTPGQRIALP